MQTALKYEKHGARTFAEDVMNRSSQNLFACYQCRKCAAGCPVADTTGVTPDQLIRKIILGDRQGALENKLVWQCVSCYACGVRCPNNIQTARITITLKTIAKEEGFKTLSPKINNFHESFSTAAKHFGRLNELEFMGIYEIKNILRLLVNLDLKGLFLELKNQAELGLHLIKNRRIRYTLERVKGGRELKVLFKMADEKKNCGLNRMRVNYGYCLLPWLHTALYQRIV